MITSPRGQKHGSINHQQKHNSAVEINVSILHPDNASNAKAGPGDMEQRISDLFSPARGKYE